MWELMQNLMDKKVKKCINKKETEIKSLDYEEMCKRFKRKGQN